MDSQGARVVARYAPGRHRRARAAQRFRSGLAVGYVDARQLSRSGLPGVRSLPRRQRAARSSGRGRRRRESSPADGGPRAQGRGLRRSAARRRCDRHRRGAPAPGDRSELSRLRGLQPAAAIAVARCRRGAALLRRAPRGAGDVRADARSSPVRLGRRAARAARAHRVQGMAGVGHRVGRARCNRCWTSLSPRWARLRRTMQGSRRCDDAARSWRPLADSGRCRRRRVGKRAMGAIDDARHVAALRARRCGRATRRARRVALERVDLHVGDARGRRQFDHFIGRLGMRDATTVRFGSPFSYERQTLLYLPRGLDPPSSPRHTEQVIDDRAAGAVRRRWARVPAVHESSRAARRCRDPVAAARSDAAVSGARSG